MLQFREDIFEGYGREAFLDAVRARAEIRQEAVVTGDQRLLVWYRRRG